MRFRISAMALLFSLAAVFAGGKNDFRFSVPLSQYNAQLKLLEADNVCVDGNISGYMISVLPKFPLDPDHFYLRHKHAGNLYGWYAGNLVPACYSKLHAFDLKANRISVYEAATLRFYASMAAKPFQDEAEIYFDKRYVYSSRVSRLYFKKNGKWQELHPSSLTGIVKVVEVPEGTILAVGQTSFKPPVTFAPVDTGLFFGAFSVPQNYPVVSGVNVQSGKTSFLTPILVPLDTEVYRIKTDITAGMVDSAESLEVTERLYDQFINDLMVADLNRGFAKFDSIYPKVKRPPKGMQYENPKYKAYVKDFDNTRARAKSLWQATKMSKVLTLNNMIKSRIEKQEEDTLRTQLVPVSARMDAQIKDVSFRFGRDSLRYDFSWEGVLPLSAPSNAIVANAQNPDSVQIMVTYQNKPVWKYEKFQVKSRHHYRYLKFEVVFRQVTYIGTGKFFLPDYILNEAEVQAWLNPPPPLPVEKDSTVAKSDSVVKDTTPAVDPSIDLFRGEVAEIDSGSFRYKNKIVALSPFAINKTEVTEAHFRRILGKDSATFEGADLPVHNVTWDKAKAFCKAVGGNLPTEAQWEYAGRAGNNEGSLWNLDEEPDAVQYAVFNRSKKEGPMPVASKKPNEWGIYDMSGNVAEWTLDDYSAFSFYVEGSNPTGSFFGYSRVIKGGSWKSSSEDDLDLTDYDDEDPRYWGSYLGFRCAFPSHQKVDLEKARRVLKAHGVVVDAPASKELEKASKK
ncbi:MAG: SUMF1/EgtB/PvdO family nonheme iron enzyme [Fibrobacteraceae bacterium]